MPEVGLVHNKCLLIYLFMKGAFFIYLLTVMDYMPVNVWVFEHAVANTSFFFTYNLNNNKKQKYTGNGTPGYPPGWGSSPCGVLAYYYYY